MSRLKVKAAHVAAMAGLLVAGLGVSAALADPGNGNGPPSPPGQGECQHGNSGQDCKPDPQPGHGKECDEHGNQGGVNEDHCLGTTDSTTTTETTTTDETTTSETTTNATTTNETTTTTTTNQTSTQETTTTPVPTTSGTPSGAFTPPAAASSGPQATPAAPVTKPELEQALAEQSAKAATGPVSHGETRPGELPFTGFPTWIIALIGSLTAAIGLGIRRLTR
jgi:hypothetical protein